MIVNEILYTAKGEAAAGDDIITLRLKFLDRDGNQIGSRMISGHSAVLNGTVYEVDAIDIDSVWVEATDLDYDGHSIKLNNYEYSLPRTGSVTRTFKIDPVGAPTVTAVAMPSAEKFTDVTGLPMPGTQEAVSPAAGAVGVGIGAGIIAVVVLLVLGSRKKT